MIDMVVSNLPEMCHKVLHNTLVGNSRFSQRLFTDLQHFLFVWDITTHFWKFDLFEATIYDELKLS